MIIGIDASRANKHQKTGVEWYAFFVIEEMKQLLTDRVSVVLYSDTPLQGELANLPPGWSSKVLPWPPKRFWTQVRLSIEMLFHGPDVLFVPAHVAPLIHPKKTVVTIHDIAPWRFPKSYSWFERWYCLWSTRYAAKRVSHIIVPSEFTKQEIHDYIKKITAHIHVIHHGIDTRFITADPGSSLSKDIRKPYILSVGRIEEKKNTRRLIEAFTLLRSQSATAYQLVLIGKPGFGYDAVRAAYNASPYKEDILFLGWTEQEQLPTLYKEASLFAFPSLYEGFGIPVVEAFAAGVPVLTAQGSCLSEIAADAALFVDPLSAASIHVGLETVLNDESLRKELIEKGKKRARTFSWEKTAKETTHILI